MCLWATENTDKRTRKENSNIFLNDWWRGSSVAVEVLGIDEQRQTNCCLPRLCSLGTNKMPRELCLHSAANADGCLYERQHAVRLLRNACRAGTMLRRKDVIISTLGISHCVIDLTIRAHAKGVVIYTNPLLHYPTLCSKCLIWVLHPHPHFWQHGGGGS